MLELIREELGLEKGEIWFESDEYTNKKHRYKILDNKLWYFDEDVNSWREAWDDEYKRLTKGELGPSWRPKEGDIYYISNVVVKDFYSSYEWDNSEYDKVWLERGIIFKTKEEAITHAKKMLEVAR